MLIVLLGGRVVIDCEIVLIVFMICKMLLFDSFVMLVLF